MKYNRNIIELILINDENKHLFPKELQEAFDFLNSGKEIKIKRNKKAMLIQNEISAKIKEDAKEILAKQPDIQLSEVIILLLQNRPKDIITEDIIDIVFIAETVFQERFDEKVAAIMKAKTKAA